MRWRHSVEVRLRDRWAAAELTSGVAGAQTRCHWVELVVAPGGEWTMRARLLDVVTGACPLCHPTDPAVRGQCPDVARRPLLPLHFSLFGVANVGPACSRCFARPVAGLSGGHTLELPVARVRLSVARFGLLETDCSLAAFERAKGDGPAFEWSTLPPAEILWAVDDALQRAGDNRRRVCGELLRACRCAAQFLDA